MKYDKALNVLPSFFPSVTDGLQPNAEESGKGCRRLHTGLNTETRAHTHFPSSMISYLSEALLYYFKFINSI